MPSSASQLPTRRAVDQRQRRGAFHGPAGFAFQPTHADQLTHPARGDGHGEAAKEMADVLHEAGGQAEAAGKEVPAAATEEIIDQAERQKHPDLAPGKPGKLRLSLFPTRRRGQTGETGKSVCPPKLNTADEVRWAFMRWVHGSYSKRKAMPAADALMATLKESFACKG